LYLLFAVVVAIIYIRGGRVWLPDPGQVLQIAWFGALGGILANFHGLQRHYDKWDPSWGNWYLVRPATSALVGTVGYLIYISIVQASITRQDASLNKPTILGYVVAFALGYREEMFRELLQRVVDLLAAAGGADVEPPSAPPGFVCALDERSERNVRLRWEHATDNVRVTGYRIYRDRRLLAVVHVGQRRDSEDEHTSEKRHERLPEFVDAALSPGFYLYSITAIDRAENESLASGPMRVEVPDTDLHTSSHEHAASAQ
jgi:hypothetical protein